jgi:hypothetical protein
LLDKLEVMLESLGLESRKEASNSLALELGAVGEAASKHL